VRQALTRRRLLHRAVLAAAVTLAGGPRRARAQGSAAGNALATAAANFLAALPAEGRRRAVFPFEDQERFNWGYVPRRRQGVLFKDMSGPARAAAHDLLKAGLSAAGYDKASGVIRLEGMLRRLETFGALSRDPENYAVTVFGAPGGAAAPWGFRIEGHHLSLNFTLAPGRPVATTPAFLGANPATVPSGALKGLRTLGREEDLGRALARSMDASQRQRMLIGTSSLGDVVSGPGRGESLKVPAGIPLGDLAGGQRDAAWRLLQEYVRNMQAEIAEEELRQIQAAGLDRIHFAWAGPLEPGHAHYYRLHGPTVLVEYDNTQNDANHIHSVWHDLRNDFGADILRAHYDDGHHRPA
jgi:Protein of unknown function (DUF3500)